MVTEGLLPDDNEPKTIKMIQVFRLKEKYYMLDWNSQERRNALFQTKAIL